MKLAEALMLRSDLQVRLNQLESRMSANVMVQEGDQPAEEPEDLIKEYEGITKEMEGLITRINKTNNATVFEDGVSLSDALVKRDILSKRKWFYEMAQSEATVRQDRYSRSELKFVATIDVKLLQKKKDDLAKSFRELDTKIQSLNWTTDLI